MPEDCTAGISSMASATNTMRRRRASMKLLRSALASSSPVGASAAAISATVASFTASTRASSTSIASSEAFATASTMRRLSSRESFAATPAASGGPKRSSGLSPCDSSSLSQRRGMSNLALAAVASAAAKRSRYRSKIGATASRCAGASRSAVTAASMFTGSARLLLPNAVMARTMARRLRASRIWRPHAGTAACTASKSWSSSAASEVISDCCLAAKASSSAAEGSFGRPAASEHATAMGAAISMRSFQ